VQPLPLNTSDFIHTVYTACFCRLSPGGEQEGGDGAAGRGRGWILAIDGVQSKS
jgi:hypothetical protein